MSRLACFFIMCIAPGAHAFLPAGALAQSTLFDSDEVIRFTLKTDYALLFEDREVESDEDPEQQPAMLSYEDVNGDTITQELKVRLRGNFRKKHCNFPPIRLNFAKKAAKNTVFEGEDKLKLVTHCKDWDVKYEQYVLLEYLTYRMYNELTDLSFKARLVQITYEDTAGKRKPLVRYGFLIEDDDAMAERNGGEKLEREGVQQQAMQAPEITMMSLFQYMIGNTDWAIPVLHNVRLVVKEGEPLPYAVPYDFDFSGFVDTNYSAPSTRLPIESVKDRLYRGFCRPEEEVVSQVAVFHEKRERLYELIDGLEPLTKRNRKDAAAYLNTFFRTLSSERRIQRAFVKNCREV